MAERDERLVEKRVWDPGGQRMRSSMKIEIEKGQFGIHRGCLPDESSAPANLERHARRGDDVENLFRQLVIAEVVLDGTRDLAVEIATRDFLLRGGLQAANVGRGNAAALCVILTDLAR